MFFKILKAKRICRKAVRIVHAQRNGFSLWKDLSYFDTEFFSMHDLTIKTTPKTYDYDGQTLPYVEIAHNDSLVLEAHAEALGRYVIDVFHDGEWVDTLNSFYREIPIMKKKYKAELRADKKRRFEPEQN